MKYALIALVTFLTFAGIASAAPTFIFQKTIAPVSDNAYDLATSTSNAWRYGYFHNLCLTGDTCISTWPVGGSGGTGSGTISTSSAISNGAGWIYATGLATVAASSSPTLNYFFATSTTASSTVNGGLAAGHFSITGQSSGCAQFGSGGYLVSTGVGCGTGSGSSNLATSSLETAGQLAYWNTTSGYPAKLDKIATTSLSVSGPFLLPSPGSLVGGSNTTLTWTGIATSTGLTTNSIPIVTAANTIGNSSISQSAGTTFINGVTPILDGGGDFIYNLIQTSGSNQIIQAVATSTAVLGNLIQSGGVTLLTTSTILTPAQFCSGGEFIVASTSAADVVITIPNQTWIKNVGACGATAVPSGFAQQFLFNDSVHNVTETATDTTEIFKYAPGSPTTLAPGKSWSLIGQLHNDYSFPVGFAQPNTKLFVYTQMYGVDTSVAIGTTTPYFPLSIASSTQQIALGDGFNGTNLWTLGAKNNSFYFATSSGSATSTVSALSINPNGQLTIPFYGGVIGCAQFSSTGLLTNTGSACGAGATPPAGSAGQLQYNGSGVFAGVSTTTITYSGFPATFPSGYGSLVGGSNTTFTWWGLSTSTAISQGQALYATSGSGVASVATTSLTANNGISLSAVLGALLGGNTATIGLSSIAGNSVLGNSTGSSAVPSAVATSSLYTFSPGLSAGTNLLQTIEHHSFTYPTTTPWTGTTTRSLEVGYGETWNSIQCYTDTGTVNVQVGYGSASTTMLNASTTAGTFNYAANNLMTAGNKVRVDLGTPASTPTTVTCTVKDTN